MKFFTNKRTFQRSTENLCVQDKKLTIFYKKEQTSTYNIKTIKQKNCAI